MTDTFAVHSGLHTEKIKQTWSVLAKLAVSPRRDIIVAANNQKCQMGKPDEICDPVKR